VAETHVLRSDFTRLRIPGSGDHAAALSGQKAMMKPVVDRGVGECVLRRLRWRAKIGDA
jgi:hypothetical protein